jgi:4-hydroxythreonine-4-phosphate dehydrogenase
VGRRTIPVIVGDGTILDLVARKLFKTSHHPFKPLFEGRQGETELVDLKNIGEVRFGTVSAEYGEASYRYVIEALKLVFAGIASAIVTCPISKAAIRRAGIAFTGHTELLAHFGGVTDYVMMMANRHLKVALATIHIPLKEVASSLNADGLFSVVSILNDSLRDFFSIPRPVLKVCGLNPHAGEQGLMGTEESIISEAVARACSLGIDVQGPFPADTLFQHGACDAYVAMYHDQGLIPVKTLDFRRTVNITLGLPFVRTSPGHGTGFDIAGKGLADPAGFVEAYRTAERMAL